MAETDVFLDLEGLQMREVSLGGLIQFRQAIYNKQGNTSWLLQCTGKISAACYSYS